MSIKNYPEFHDARLKSIIFNLEDKELKVVVFLDNGKSNEGKFTNICFRDVSHFEIHEGNVENIYFIYSFEELKESGRIKYKIHFSGEPYMNIVCAGFIRS